MSWQVEDATSNIYRASHPSLLRTHKNLIGSDDGDPRNRRGVKRIDLVFSGSLRPVLVFYGKITVLAKKGEAHRFNLSRPIECSNPHCGCVF